MYKKILSLIMLMITTTLLSSCSDSNTPSPLDRLNQRQQEIKSNCQGYVTSKSEYTFDGDAYIRNVCWTDKNQYCMSECRTLFTNLNDTWGINTANQTDLGTGINQCVDTCMIEYKKLK